jgi:hypothetical protein
LFSKEELERKAEEDALMKRRERELKRAMEKEALMEEKRIQMEAMKRRLAKKQ